MYRLPSIQLLRAFAALLVVVFHVSGSTMLVGAAGVDIFFVISGLVMWIVTEQANTRPATFAFDRLARILPLYWICTLAIAVATILLPKMFATLVLTPAWLAASLLLVPSYEPGTNHLWPVLAQGWTLSYEMLFYAILLAAQFLDRANRTLFVTGAILILVAIGTLVTPSSAQMVVYTNPLLLEFLAGFWLGKLAAEHQSIKKPFFGWLLLGAAIAGFAIAVAEGFDPSGWMRLLEWGLPALALVFAAISLDGKLRRLFARPVFGKIMRFGALLGDASYAIYLTHGFAISILRKIWTSAGLPQPHSVDISSILATAYAVAAVIACIALGLSVHLTLERWLTKMLKPLRPQTRQPAQAR